MQLARGLGTAVAVEALGPLEHQVLENVGGPGVARQLVARAHPVDDA